MSIPQTKNLLLLFVCVCVPRERQKCELKKKMCVCVPRERQNGERHNEKGNTNTKVAVKLHRLYLI